MSATTLEARTDPPAGRSERLTTVALVATLTLDAAAGLRWLVTLVGARDRGLDFSDEAYYVLFARDPGGQVATNSDFGFYLRPIWLASGGSIARFRVLGVLLMLAVVAFSASRVPLVRRLDRAVLIAGTACVALTFYAGWLVTPGYNFLTLIGVLGIAGILVALVEPGARESARRMRPSLVALGALITAGLAVKATAFLVLAVVSVLFVAVAPLPRRRRQNLRDVAVGLFIGGVLHLVLLASSPIADVQRFRRGLTAFRLLESHTSQRLWQTDFLESEVVPFAITLGAVWLVSRLVVPRCSRRTADILVALGCLVLIGWMWRQHPEGGSALFSGGTGWWWLRVTGWTLLAIAVARGPSGGSWRGRWAAPTIALLAVAATVGTNVGIIRQVALTASPLALAVGLAHCDATRRSAESGQRSRLLFLSFFALAGATSWILVGGAVEDPYRLGEPLADNTVATEVPGLGTLRLDRNDASFVADLRVLAARVNPAALDCLVNLTGGTPGATFALGSRPAGFPWLPGGYPGSQAMAEYVLDRTECLAGPVALLEAPDGARAIERPAVLADREFVVVGEVRYEGYLSETQVLSVSDAPAG